MKEIISKELLSVVAPKYDFCDEITVDENELVFWKDGEMHNDINIYELAHKCKELAIKDGKYVLYSAIAWNDSAVCIANLGTETQERFYADTEPEAIFKACEWILKESK